MMLIQLPLSCGGYDIPTVKTLRTPTPPPMIPKPSVPAGHPTELPIPEAYWVIPGRLLVGEYPGIPFAPERTRQRLDAFLEAGFDNFIDLTGPAETATPYEPILLEQAGAYGVEVRHTHFPIGDFGVPSIDGMNSVLDGIDASLARGARTYLHCYGGIGRTGTVVGCFLVRHGQSGEAALQQLAAWWQKVPKHTRYPHSPETLTQEAFVREWKNGG